LIPSNLFKPVQKLLLSIGSFIARFPKKRYIVSLDSFERRSPVVSDSIKREKLLLNGESIKISLNKIFPKISNCWSVMPIYLRLFEKVSINSRSSVIFFQNSKNYCLEHSWGWGKRSTNHIFKFRRGAYKFINSEKPLYILSGYGYHAIVEDIPLILLLKNKGFNFDIVIEKNNLWAKKILNEIFSDKVRIFECNDNTWVGSNQLISTSKSLFGEFIHTKLVTSLKNIFPKPPESSSKIKKIFISRADSSKRFNQHEPLLHKYFIAKGYSIIELSNLSVNEQIKIFQNITHVAGFHGAGFVNLVWSLKKVKVLEIFSDQHYNSCYFSLSYAMGHEYANIDIEEFIKTNCKHLLLSK